MTLLRFALRRATTLLALGVATTAAASAFVACGGSDSASGSGGAGGNGNCPRVVLKAQDQIPLPPNGEAACETPLCNYQTQSGCAEDQACRPSFPAGSATVTPACEPFGTGETADPCDTSSDCARGYLCATVIPSPDGGITPAVSRCYQQCCDGDWTACASGTSCSRQFMVRFADDHVEHPVDLCVPTGTCDLFDPTSCQNDSDPPTPRECKIVDPTGAVACMPKSTRKLGDSCSADTNTCAQGFTCVFDTGAPDVGHCRRLCRAELCGEPSCPPAEGICVHFNRNPPGVGECAPIFEQ